MSIKHLKKTAVTVFSFFCILLLYCSYASGTGTGASIDSVALWGGNSPGGQFVKFSCRVLDIAPWDIESLKVYGPDGREYRFDTEKDISCHYRSGAIYTIIEPPYDTPDGQYNFILEDRQGNVYTAGRYFISNLIDWVDLYSGASPVYGVYINTTTPTLNWQPVSDETASPLYYRINIREWNQQRIIYSSNRSTSAFAVIPAGALSPNTAYEWQVQAFDGQDETSINNFSSSVWMSFYTGDPNQSLGIDFAFVYSKVNPDGDETLFGVKVTGPAPYYIRSMLITGPNGFSYQFDPAMDYKDGIYFHSDGCILSDGNYTFTVIDDRNGATDFETKAFSFNRLPIPRYTFSPVCKSYTGTTTPTFNWEAVTDETTDPLYYRINIFDCNGNIIYRSTPSITTMATVDPNILRPDNPYYWRVEVLDSSSDPQNISATSGCPFYVYEEDSVSAVSGQVFIDPNVTGYATGGKIFISAFDGPPPWKEGQPLGMTAISNTGPYTIYDLAIDTNIYIGALWDKDGSECYTAGDWSGSYLNNPVVLSDSNMAANIDIYLVSEVQAASVSGRILCDDFDPNTGALYVFAYDGPHPQVAHLLECAQIVDPNNQYAFFKIPVDSYAYIFALWDKDGDIDPNHPEYMPTSQDFNGGYTGNPLLAQGAGHTGIDIPIVNMFSFAIDSGLQWLRGNQNPDGSWGANQYVLGTTEFAALAFLNYGYDETDPNVAAAINFILGHARQSDGAISESESGSTVSWVDNYTTAIGIMVLTAADKYNNPPKYTQVISNAVRYLLNIQNTESNIAGFDQSNPAYGGWGYGQPDYSGESVWSDLSNSQWDMLALREAKGQVDPNYVTVTEIDDALSKALIFTQRCQNRPATNDLPWAHDLNNFSYNDGGFVYNPGSDNFVPDPWSYGSYDTMTYAGIWGLYCCGVPAGDPRMGDALNWAHNNFNVDPSWRGYHALYYTYYTMSKALTVIGNASDIVNSNWFAALSSQLIGMQEPDGSWINPDNSEAEGIRALTTSYALLSLATHAPSETATLEIALTGNATLCVTAPDGSQLCDPNILFEAGAVQYGSYIIDINGTGAGSYTLNARGQEGSFTTEESSAKGIEGGETHKYDLVIWPGIGLDIDINYLGSNIPFIEINQPNMENEQADDLYMITWLDSDIDDNAVIRIYYDNDTNAGNGYLGEISPADGLEEDSQNFLNWDVSGFAAGQSYYICGVIADSNTTMTAWSAGTVTASPDGMPMDWEQMHGLDLYRPDGDGDIDGDNMSNLEEYSYRFIDPNGRSTNPRAWDTDGDSLPDGFEAQAGDVNVLNPNEWDTDGDGIPDRDEDPDNDGFSNLEEFYAGTNPLDINSRPPVPVNYPTVVSVTPIDGSVRVPVDTSILIQFNMQMDRQSVENNLEIVDEYENPVNGQFQWMSAMHMDDTVKFIPDYNLEYSQSYGIYIHGGCQDAINHNGLNGYWEGEESYFATIGAPWDNSAPEVISVFPYDGQTGGDTGLIGAFFTKPIDPYTVSPDNFSLAGPGIDDPNDYTLEVGFEPYGVFIKPINHLTPDSYFTITLKTGITDTEGHPLQSEYSWGFNSGQADTDPPYITQTIPVDGSTNASPWAHLDVYFSENMDPNTVNSTSVTVYDETANLFKNIHIVKDLEDRDRSHIVIRPVFEDGQWVAGHAYRVNISGTVSDISGNTIGPDYAFTFTVADFPYYAPELLLDECQGIKKPDGSTMIELILWANSANGNQNINATATDLTQTGKTWNLINNYGDGSFVYKSQGDEGINSGYHEIEFKVTDTVNGQVTKCICNLYIFNTYPVIVYPDDNTSGVSLTPDLSWDTNGIVHEDSYEVVIFDGPDPETSKNIWKTYVIADGSPNYTVTVPPCRELAPSTQYYWAVIAHESHDWSQGYAHSRIYSFITTYKEVCNEDDSGNLDIKGGSGLIGGLTVISVRVQNAPNDVNAFGFEFNYNPYVLEYKGFVPGGCVAGFDFFDISQPYGPGMLRIGGVEANNPIPVDSNCVLVNLEFTVTGEAAQDISSMLWLGNMKDDMAGWPSSIGCFIHAGCDGDLNRDGSITPRDALCAFQKYLDICPTSCGPCDQMCCDVNIDGGCTPADALWIFRKYLGLPVSAIY